MKKLSVVAKKQEENERRRCEEVLKKKQIERKITHLRRWVSESMSESGRVLQTNDDARKRAKAIFRGYKGWSGWIGDAQQ